MQTGMIIFYASFLTVFGLVLYLCFRQFVQPIKGKYRKWVIIGFVLFCFMAIVPPYFYRTMKESFSEDLLQVLMMTHYSIMGLLSFVFVLSILARLSHPLINLWRVKTNRPKREFLSQGLNAAILGVSGLGTLWGVKNALGDFNVKKVQIKRPNCEGLEGFRLVQATDIHIGPTLGKDFLQRIVDTINDESPSAVAITGDLLDGRVHELRDKMQPLSELHPTHGTYFVTGNHEYYWGAHQWNKFLPTLGLRVLENESEIIDFNGRKIAMSGVPDYRTSERVGIPSSPNKAMESAREAQLKILLAHQPSNCYEAGEAGFDLQLSGHTHAGQFWPWTWVIHFFHPYVNGLNDHNGMHVYVNPGTGYWGPPVRSGPKPEITVFEFVT